MQCGIEPATAHPFGVGLFAGRGMTSGRVVVPIHDQRGRLAGRCSVNVLDLPPDEQPDRLSSQEIRQLLKPETKI